MKITKHKDEYLIENSGEQLAKVETYRNTYHKNHCYIKFDLEDTAVISEANLFQKIADEEKSPLQVMISSLETQKTTFLTSQGFKKARISHEMEVKKQDLLKGLSSGESKIFKAIRGQNDYRECCELLFNHYKETHQAINPLSATFEDFTKILPAEVYYVKNNSIQHVAFVSDNLIAYVCSKDESTFENFVLAVVNKLFEENQSIEFEADDVDWAAMTLKNLFLTDSTESFDTWIY